MPDTNRLTVNNLWGIWACRGIVFWIQRPDLHLLVDKDRMYELGFVPRFSNRLQIRSKDKN